MRHDGVASGYPTPTCFLRLTGPRDRGVIEALNRCVCNTNQECRITMQECRSTIQMCLSHEIEVSSH